MIHKTLLLAPVFAVVACAEAAAPFEPPVLRVTATVTEDNKCTVSAMGKTYSSSDQIRGDKPAKFVGTVADRSYHGFGCVVHADGVPGDIIVLFSGNNFGKPLAPGTYPLSLEILDGTRPKVASVIFDSQDYGPFKLRTADGAGGTVTVTETASGGRKITVDVDMIQWGDPIA